tara:strand:- start:772 stop:1086 length:315 start_codon:yes stop_codon:yes gene_type:complete
MLTDKTLILAIKEGKEVFKEVDKLPSGTWTFIYNPNGESYYINKSDPVYRSKQRQMNAQGEDLTVDGYISKYGGIKSPMTDEVFSSKRSYMDHLKSKNCIIKDW